MKKVVLIGYMGCGKSLISKKLATEVGFSFLDMDEEIEKDQEKTISEIFSTKGELFFRKLEHQLLVNSINSSKSLIISTGGGTPCYYNNIDLINSENCISIYLKASIDTLYKHLINEKNKRPLIANLDNFEIKEYIAKHLFERSFYYNQAKIIISVDEKSVDEIVNEIKKALA